MKLHTLILALVTGAALSLTAVTGASASTVCTSSAMQGRCGPLADSSIIGNTSSTYVDNDVWRPVTPMKQELHVTSPGDWYVAADMAKGRTAVESYPSIDAEYGQASDVSTPLSDYIEINSSANEDMHANDYTSAWAAYDIWLGLPGSSTWSEEILIQHSYYRTVPCHAVAQVVFGGYNGTQRLTWDLCDQRKGTFIIWRLPSNSGTVSINVLAMLDYLTDHGYLAKDSGLFAIGYGWEIASTGGVNENFQVRSFSITAWKR